MQEQTLPDGTAAVGLMLAAWPVMDAFYLSGGTALALHFGHRQSRHLGFFTKDPVGRLPALSGIDDALEQFTTVQWELRTAE